LAITARDNVRGIFMNSDDFKVKTDEIDKIIDDLSNKIKDYKNDHMIYDKAYYAKIAFAFLLIANVIFFRFSYTTLIIVVILFIIYEAYMIGLGGHWYKYHQHMQIIDNAEKIIQYLKQEEYRQSTRGEKYKTVECTLGKPPQSKPPDNSNSETMQAKEIKKLHEKYTKKFLSESARLLKKEGSLGGLPFGHDPGYTKYKVTLSRPQFFKTDSSDSTEKE